MTLTPCHLQLHRNRCHSLSPPLTSSISSSQQPWDNWSSSWRSPQREKGKTDTTERTFNLYEPTEMEPGEGRDKTARRTVGDRGSTDELGGVGKRGGLVCLTPFNTLRRKAGQNPSLDKGCYGNPSPLGHEISGESTDRTCLQRVCGNRKNVMSSLLFKVNWARRYIKRRFSFLLLGHKRIQYIHFSLSRSTCASALSACL